MPERHFAGFAGSGRDDDAIVSDFFDAPGGGAEDDSVTGAAFENHFFVEFTNAGASCCTGEEDAVEPAIGNSTAIDNGDAAGALPRREAIGDAIPGDAGTQLGEFVAGIASGEHVENTFKNRASE